ncbi:hypothetical protein DICVIV_03815 [Dictyocaulus viviparus]|uniref:Uncharacterized protein n=1 Tax=Dictyocaulus viviparus TaxID=29172 RepID=A0A0D8Y1U1_DICVI|nr:hypothetical protein DICVIV_03815 [Dictyocaulus viviparus]
MSRQQSGKRRLVAPEVEASFSETTFDSRPLIFQHPQDGRQYYDIASKKCPISKGFSCSSLSKRARNQTVTNNSNDKEDGTWTSREINCRLDDIIKKPHQSAYGYSQDMWKDSNESSEFGLSNDDRFHSSVKNLATMHQEKFSTPSSFHASTPMLCNASDESVLPGVVTRVLSALPPLYLRDDHTESLPDRGGLREQSITPDLEKLFNLTVLKSNATEHPDLSFYHVFSDCKHGFCFEHMSLMTPLSVNSPILQLPSDSSCIKNECTTKYMLSSQFGYLERGQFSHLWILVQIFNEMS